jgi:predicted kinase
LNRVLLDPRSDDVVVVAGLPGAGKTTLVASEPRALDSDAVREAWAPRLAPLPYALWRPLAHAWHLIAVWRALGRPDGVIVVRPFTHAWLRRALLRHARRRHPGVHLVVVDATPEQARAGQRARGRSVRERAMRRHERRWERADLAREPWTSVNRVRRWTDGRRTGIFPPELQIPSEPVQGHAPGGHGRSGGGLHESWSAWVRGGRAGGRAAGAADVGGR